MNPIPMARWLMLALWLPTLALAQGDERTREIQERDRHYYDRQKAAAGQQPEKADREAERHALRDALIQKADALVRDRNYSGKASARYKVQTDDPRLSAAASARLLEVFRSHFEAFWDGTVELAPYEETSHVYLFYSYFKYNQLYRGADRVDALRSAGHYRPWFDVVVVHTDAEPGGLGDVLVHEAAHQLVAQQLLPGVHDAVPAWLSEGLASYFGFTFQGPDGTFQPGVVGGKSAALFPQARRTQAGNGWQRLRAFRQGWKKGTVWPLGTFLALGPEAFYGEGVEDRYVASWLLVHYLLHGEDGAHRDGLSRYLARVRQGEAGPEVLLDAVSRTEEELAGGYTRHVLRLKPGLRKSR